MQAPGGENSKRKREEYAVNLRNAKKDEAKMAMKAKRQQMMEKEEDTSSTMGESLQAQ